MSFPRRLAPLLLWAFLLPAGAAWAADDGLPPLSTGQTVYVPVYSHVLHGNVNERGLPDELLFSAMLSARNTDPNHPMTLASVNYYDTQGKIIRPFLSKPTTLPPMGSTDFFVEHKDRTGGTGANFLVVWKADAPINPPIFETVHVYFWGTQSKVFVSRGQALRLSPPPDEGGGKAP